MLEDRTSSMYPYPSRRQLEREADQDARQSDAEKDMQPVSDVFTVVEGMAKHLRAIAPSLPGVASDAAAAYADGLDDWLRDAKDITGYIKRYHGVE